MNNEIIILDYIDNISIDTTNPPFNNYQAFYRLFFGLHNIAAEVRSFELEKLKLELQPDFCIDFTCKPIDLLILNYFDWFSITITNYIRLIGLFDLMIKNNWKSTDLLNNEKTVSLYCKNFVDKHIPEIQYYRNKISAHLAATDPRKDTLGTIEMTLFSFVTYCKPYYEVGSINFSIGEEKSDFKGWSLTKTYDRLTPRFWPTAKLISLDQTL